jgi:hypothetical protein
MRDKDSQLIFESYKKKVILNEYAQALAVPAVAGLDAAIAVIAGTAAGGVILNKIYEAWKTLSPSAQANFEKDIEVLKSAMTSEDDSFRSTYETLNAIQGVANDSSLKEIVEETKNYLKTLNYYQDTVEGDSQILAQLAQDFVKLNTSSYNFAKKQKALTGLEAADKAAERYAELANKALDLANKTGGGQPPTPPPQPPNKGKGGLIATAAGAAAGSVASFWKEIKSLILENKKIVAFLALLSCPELAGWLTSRTKEAGEEALKGITGDEIGKPEATPKPKPKATPKPKPKATPKPIQDLTLEDIPESEYVDDSDASANPSPTPFKRRY